MADVIDAAPLVDNLIGNTSIIAITFGVGPARKRAMRFLRQAYRKDGPHRLLPEATFCYLCLHIPGLNDPAHVWVNFWEGVELHYTDPYWVDIFNSKTGQMQPARFHLLAVNTDRPDLIIPSRLWIPYNGTQRSEIELDRSWMLPTYFASSNGGVGVPLSENNQGYFHLSDEPTRFRRQTVTVHLHLHNYEARYGQIRVGNPSADLGASIRHMARQLATAVRELITNIGVAVADIEPGMTRWRFGPGEGFIHVDDIILLGFVHISPGRVTPLLGLRGDFRESGNHSHPLRLTASTCPSFSQSSSP